MYLLSYIELVAEATLFRMVGQQHGSRPHAERGTGRTRIKIEAIKGRILAEDVRETEGGRTNPTAHEGTGTVPSLFA